MLCMGNWAYPFLMVSTPFRANYFIAIKCVVYVILTIFHLTKNLSHFIYLTGGKETMFVQRGQQWARHSET